MNAVFRLERLRRRPASFPRRSGLAKRVGLAKLLDDHSHAAGIARLDVDHPLEILPQLQGPDAPEELRRQAEPLQHLVAIDPLEEARMHAR